MKQTLLKLAKLSTIWGYALALFATWFVLFLFNVLFVSPRLSHLNEPVEWTAENNVRAIAEAYGDEETGVFHLPPHELKTFPAFAFNGSFVAAAADESLWTKWVQNGHTIQMEVVRASQEKKAVRKEELKVQHRATNDAATSEGCFLSIIWSPDRHPTVDEDKSGDARRFVVLEMYAPPERTEIRYQIYAFDNKEKMIGTRSPAKGRLLLSRPNYFLFRPCLVTTSERALAETFFIEGKRLYEAAGLQWSPPPSDVADRVTRYVESVLLRWTSRDGENLQQLTETARFFNGPDSSGFIQFLIQFVFWSAILNIILHRYFRIKQPGKWDAFRNSLLPMEFALLTIVLFGTLGTMLGMRAVSQEIGQPELNTISISTGLSIAYDTTALALCAVLIVSLLSLFYQGSREESRVTLVRKPKERSPDNS